MELNLLVTTYSLVVYPVVLGSGRATKEEPPAS